MLKWATHRIRWLILTVFICLGAVGTVMLSRRSGAHMPQPVYAGRAFDVWLGEVSTVPDYTDPAVAAIRQMGAPALPFLLKARVEGKAAKHTRLQSWEVQDRAAEALIALGPSAAPLSSALLPHLKAGNKRLRSHVAQIFGRM